MVNDEHKYFELMEFIIKQQVRDGIPHDEIIEQLETMIRALKKMKSISEEKSSV